MKKYSNCMNLAKQCADKMMKNDHYSSWLGIEILILQEGYCKIQMVIRKNMLNGFGLVHGGVLFSFADSAFAFSCNTYNNLSLALSCSISFPKSGLEGDIIVAEARELEKTNKTGTYDVTVSNQKKEVLARFRGIAYRTGKKVI